MYFPRQTAIPNTARGRKECGQYSVGEGARRDDVHAAVVVHDAAPGAAVNETGSDQLGNGEGAHTAASTRNELRCDSHVDLVNGDANRRPLDGQSIGSIESAQPGVDVPLSGLTDRTEGPEDRLDSLVPVRAFGNEEVAERRLILDASFGRLRPDEEVACNFAVLPLLPAIGHRQNGHLLAVRVDSRIGIRFIASSNLIVIGIVVRRVHFVPVTRGRIRRRPPSPQSAAHLTADVVPPPIARRRRALPSARRLIGRTCPSLAGQQLPDGPEHGLRHGRCWQRQMCSPLANHISTNTTTFRSMESMGWVLMRLNYNLLFSI